MLPFAMWGVWIMRAEWSWTAIARMAIVLLTLVVTSSRKVTTKPLGKRDTTMFSCLSESGGLLVCGTFLYSTAEVIQ